jgi:hypothetical protein
MVFKLNAAMLRTVNCLGGDETMIVQKMDSRTKAQESETLCAMTIAQIDQALRDFVLQDTARLRQDAETAFHDASRREPEAPRMVSEFVRRMAGASLTKLDETIVDLSQLRDFLHAESERIKREISCYLQFNQVAMGSTKLVVDDIAQCRAAAAASIASRRTAESEGSNTTASPDQNDFAI